MNKKVLFSHKTDDWATPKDIYAALNEEFQFTFDPCPLRATFDGLSVEWKGNIFVNPPYTNITAFFKKAWDEILKCNSSVCVFLVPSRTDTKWFHEYVYGKAEIRFIKGRLKFGGSKNSAPFPSMICILRNPL